MSVSPELREFVLSLPLDVRQELAKCDGPGWRSIGAPLLGALVELCPQSPGSGDAVYDDVSGNRRAWLPVSPIAIALHAARLLGADEASLVIDFGGGGYTYAKATSQPVDGEPVPYQFADVQSDPTGHRAAIALLQKVIAEVTP